MADMSTSTPATGEWLTPDEQRAWRAYRRMRQLLDLELNRDLARDAGLSEPDYDVLSTLSESAEAAWRVGALARRLLWSTSRLTHHLDRMEARGLVTRGTCDDDRRGATVALTELGWSTLTEAAASHVWSVRKHFIDLLTPAELGTVAVVAERVIDRLISAPSPPTW
jgi:DNA-binding MarR family transcriptional regulator